MISILFSNPIVQSVFFAAAGAQFFKFLLHKKATGSWSWKSLFRDAGMPSTHTATVTALTICVFWIEGITTLSLAVLTFALVIIRDVIGDKIFAEKQENMINDLIHKLQDMLEGHRVEWKHFIGHTIGEVIAGAAWGTLVALLVLWY